MVDVPHSQDYDPELDPILSTSNEVPNYSSNGVPIQVFIQVITCLSTSSATVPDNTNGGYFAGYSQTITLANLQTMDNLTVTGPLDISLPAGTTVTVSQQYHQQPPQCCKQQQPQCYQQQQPQCYQQRVNNPSANPITYHGGQPQLQQGQSCGTESFVYQQVGNTQDFGNYPEQTATQVVQQGRNLNMLPATPFAPYQNHGGHVAPLDNDVVSNVTGSPMYSGIPVHSKTVEYNSEPTQNRPYQPDIYAHQSNQSPPFNPPPHGNYQQGGNFHSSPNFQSHQIPHGTSMTVANTHSQDYDPQHMDPSNGHYRQPICGTPPFSNAPVDYGNTGTNTLTAQDLQRNDEYMVDNMIFLTNSETRRNFQSNQIPHSTSMTPVNTPSQGHTPQYMDPTNGQYRQPIYEPPFFNSNAPVDDGNTGTHTTPIQVLSLNDEYIEQNTNSSTNNEVRRSPGNFGKSMKKKSTKPGKKPILKHAIKKQRTEKERVNGNVKNYDRRNMEAMILNLPLSTLMPKFPEKYRERLKKMIARWKKMSGDPRVYTNATRRSRFRQFFRVKYLSKLIDLLEYRFNGNSELDENLKKLVKPYESLKKLDDIEKYILHYQKTEQNNGNINTFPTEEYLEPFINSEMPEVPLEALKKYVDDNETDVIEVNTAKLNDLISIHNRLPGTTKEAYCIVQRV